MLKHHRTNAAKRLAVIDIGTANTKVVIAEMTAEKQIAILHRDQQRTHIPDGKSSAPSGTLTVEQVLKQYMAALSHYSVESYRVLGTESLRYTQGSGDLSVSIAALTNKEVEVLSQEQEAALFFGAVSAYMPGEMAVVDVGGGSVQIILGSEEGIKQLYPLKTGTVTLDRTFLHGVFPRDETIENVWKHVRSEVEKLHLPLASHCPLVFGSTRILTFFRIMEVGVEDRSYGIVHPRKARVADLEELYSRLVPLTEEERKQLFPIEPFFMRGADLSLINVICICKALGINEIVPSNLNLSDGVLLSLL